MDGWWLKAQGDLRIAEPVSTQSLSNFNDGALSEYCGFTKQPQHAFMWCCGDIERLAASQKECVMNMAFNGTQFWKNP